MLVCHHCQNSMMDPTGACANCGKMVRTTFLAFSSVFGSCAEANCARSFDSALGCTRKTYGKSQRKCCEHFFGETAIERGCGNCSQFLKSRKQATPALAASGILSPSKRKISAPSTDRNKKPKTSARAPDEGDASQNHSHPGRAAQAKGACADGNYSRMLGGSTASKTPITGSSGTAKCNVTGCQRSTWDGQPGQCCRTCLTFGGTLHGPECNKRAATSKAKGSQVKGACTDGNCSRILGGTTGCTRLMVSKCQPKCCVHFFPTSLLKDRGCKNCQLPSQPTGSIAGAAGAGRHSCQTPCASGVSSTGVSSTARVSVTSGTFSATKTPIAGTAKCNVTGCQRSTWDGQPGQCCRTCLTFGGTLHGPECNKRAAASTSSGAPSQANQGPSATSQGGDPPAGADRAHNIILDISRRQHWASDGKQQQKLFKVVRGTQEFSKVSSMFLSSLPSQTLVRIERVECGRLLESFSRKQCDIKSDTGTAFCDKKMLRLLFHGSEPETLQKIIHAGEGFIPLYSGSRVGHLFGKGTYFATQAQMAQRYSSPNRSGERQMLVAAVVVGRWTKGQADMLKIPVLPGEKYRTFNSMVDCEEKPRIFVIQNAQQAYPAYLITFK